MTCRDHRVTGRQTFHNFHLARLAQADLDRHTLGHAHIGLVTLHHLDHEGAPALRDDGLFGDDQGVFPGAKHSVDAGKHARAQLLLAVVDTATHANRAAIGFNQRVHGLHDGRERPPRQGIHRQLRFLTRSDLGLKTLRQTKVEQHRIDVFHVDHVRAVFEVIAHVDLLEACDAIKRSQNLQALQRGLCQRQLRARDLQGCSALVQRALADEVLRHQFLVALMVGLGNGQFCTRLSDLGLLQLVLQLHHQLTLAHALAVVEENLFDAPTHFRAQHHALARAQTAHGLGLVNQSHALDLSDLHDRRPACSACRPSPWRTSGRSTGCSRRTAWPRSSRGGRRTVSLGLVLPPPCGPRGYGNAQQGQQCIFLLVSHSSFSQVADAKTSAM